MMLLRIRLLTITAIILSCVVTLEVAMNFALAELPAADSYVQKEEDSAKAESGNSDEDGEPEAADADEEKPSERGSLAQRWLERMRNLGQPKESQKNHKNVLSAFNTVVAPIADSTVVVYSGDKVKALGAIVSAEGHIITKASEFGDNSKVELKDGRELAADLLGIHDEHDLAMLKVDADGLTPIDFSKRSTPPLGSFLVTAGIGEAPVAYGVVSATSRKINQQPGVLGIQIAEGDDGPTVEVVMPRSGAQKAGLKKGDVVLSVNGTRTKNREQLIGTVRTFKPGETVKLKLKREGEEMVLSATLGARFTGPGAGRGDFQNQLGGSLSERRTGFEKIIQHDTVLTAAQCGGPVVDLDGNLVGLNIARAGRVASYLLPAQLVSVAVDDLKSGKFAVEDPAPNIAFQIAELELQIEQTQAELDQAQSKAAQAKAQYDFANKAFSKAQAARNAAKKEADEASREKQKLEEQINELKQQRLKLESQ